MDIVTVVAACAIGLRSELFVPLGVRGDCARAAAIGAEPLQDKRPPPIDRWSMQIAAASQRFGVPERILRAVMRAESGGVQTITSSAGAMGLMQLMPETWATMRARYRLGADPYAPADNIMAGAAFLRELIDRYGAPDFLAAYNAGPARLEDHRLRGRALPDETRRYVAQLAPEAQGVSQSSVAMSGTSQNAGSGRPALMPPDHAPMSSPGGDAPVISDLFAMDRSTGARPPVLSDRPDARAIGAVSSSITAPNVRDGGAIFAPIVDAVPARSASAITGPTE